MNLELLTIQAFAIGFFSLLINGFLSAFTGMFIAFNEKSFKKNVIRKIDIAISILKYFGWFMIAVSVIIGCIEIGRHL